MASTAVTDMADTTGSAGASPADLFLTESEASDVAQKPVPIVPPPAAASGRPAEAGSRIAADSQAVNTAKAAAFRRPSIASAAQLAAGRHRQASGVFRGFRLQQPAAADLPVPSHQFHLIIRLPMGLLPIVHAHGSTVRRVSPINVSVDISCGPDMPVGDILKPGLAISRFQGVDSSPMGHLSAFQGVGSQV